MAVHRSPASSPRRKWTAASQTAKATSPGEKPKKVASGKTSPRRQDRQDLPSPYSKTSKHSRKGSLSPSLSAPLISYPSAFRKRHKFRVQAFVLCIAFAAVSSGILFLVAMRVPNIDDSVQQQTLVLPDAFQQRTRKAIGVDTVDAIQQRNQKTTEANTAETVEKLSTVDISAYGDTIAGRRQGGYVISGRGASLLETQRAKREKQEREEMERQRLEQRKQQLEKLLENIPADTDDKGKSAKASKETAVAAKKKGANVGTGGSAGAAASKSQGKKRVASQGTKEERPADSKPDKRRAEDSKGGKELPQKAKKEAEESSAKKEGKPKEKPKGGGQKDSGSKPGDKGASRKVDAGKGKKASGTGKGSGKGGPKNPGNGSKERQAKKL